MELYWNVKRNEDPMIHYFPMREGQKEFISGRKEIMVAIDPNSC